MIDKTTSEERISRNVHRPEIENETQLVTQGSGVAVEFIPVDENNIVQTSQLLRSPQIASRPPPSTPSIFASLPEKALHLGSIRRSLEVSARAVGFRDGESESDEDEEPTKLLEFGGGEGHAVAGTATLEEHLLMRALDKDFTPLVVLEVSTNMETIMRTDMNRLDLLAQCRRAAAAYSFQEPAPLPIPPRPAMKEGLRRSVSATGLNSLWTARFRSRSTAAPPPPDPSSSWRSTGGGLGAPVQLRDIRCLQGVAEPALLVRRGVVIVSIDPINAIITSEGAYMVIPDGADELLAPLLRRLREARDPDAPAPAPPHPAGQASGPARAGGVGAEQADGGGMGHPGGGGGGGAAATRGGGSGEGGGGGAGGMPFEFVALEALLVTLVDSLIREVDLCQRVKARLLQGVRRRISSRVLTRILRLKRRIDEVFQAVRGAEAALEEAQRDDETMALMYLTAMRDGPAAYARALRAGRFNVLQAEVILDAYALEFGSLGRSLALARQDIEATEDLLRFRLDRARNKLILLDVLFGMTASFLAALTLIGGFYGMNLPHGSYADGSAAPGSPFAPPTGGGGDGYDEAWPGGPSRSFLAVSVGSSAAVASAMALAFCVLRRSGALRS